MTNSQQRRTFSRAWWALPRGAIQTLVMGSGRQCLQVLEGRVWITTSGTAQEAAADIWLQAGDEWELPAFSRWVAEADTAARFQLLVPPQVGPRARRWAGLPAWFGSLGRPAVARCGAGLPAQ